MDNIKLKRIAYNLASDVLERSDDEMLIKDSEYLRDYVKSIPIEREHAIEEASEYFAFEGMKFNNDGDEMETPEEVEQKAVEFLENEGFIIC